MKLALFTTNDFLKRSPNRLALKIIIHTEKKLHSIYCIFDQWCKYCHIKMSLQYKVQYPEFSGSWRFRILDHLVTKEKKKNLICHFAVFCSRHKWFMNHVNTKFAIFSDLYLTKLVFFSATLGQNLRFFRDPMTKFAFFSWLFHERIFFMWPIAKLIIFDNYLLKFAIFFSSRFSDWWPTVSNFQTECLKFSTKLPLNHLA